MIFQFVRSVRTPASESYVIWCWEPGQVEKKRTGCLDLHFDQKIFHGTLIIEQEITSVNLNFLLSEIDQQLVDIGRDDFIFAVYEGREVGYYSDSITEEDRAYHGATRADVKELQSTLSKVLGRHQDARGKLTEHAVCAYFQSIGYDTARRAGAELDANKIDVVAESEAEIVYAQSKLGEISSSEIRKMVNSVALLPEIDHRKKVAALIARSFPRDSEVLRRQLQTELGIDVMCIQLYQVAAASPEYRHPLGI